MFKDAEVANLYPLPQQFLGFAEPFLGMFAFGDVVKEDGDLPLLGPAQPEGVHVVEPAESYSRIFKTPGLAGQSDLPVDLVPVLLVRRRDLTHSSSNGVRYAGLLLKDTINFQKTVIERIV